MPRGPQEPQTRDAAGRGSPPPAPRSTRGHLRARSALGSRRGPGPPGRCPRVRWVSQPPPPRGRLCARPHPARDTSGCAPATGAGLPPRPPPSLPCTGGFGSHGNLDTARRRAAGAAAQLGARSRSRSERGGVGWGGEGPAAGAAQRPSPSPQPRGGAGRGRGGESAPSRARGGHAGTAPQGRAVRADQGGTRAAAAPAPP